MEWWVEYINENQENWEKDKAKKEKNRMKEHTAWNGKEVEKGKQEKNRSRGEGKMAGMERERGKETSENFPRNKQ